MEKDAADFYKDFDMSGFDYSEQLLYRKAQRFFVRPAFPDIDEVGDLEFSLNLYADYMRYLLDDLTTKKCSEGIQQWKKMEMNLGQ